LKAFNNLKIGIKLTGELVNAMDSVSAVVVENTASTEEMAAASSEVTKTIQNIASVSEENSASTEEVSASAEEMNAQVEEVTASAQSLAEMAQTLQNVVSQFKLTDREQLNQEENNSVNTLTHYNSSLIKGKNSNHPIRISSKLLQKVLSILGQEGKGSFPLHNPLSQESSSCLII
jgi:hypothetical protein